MQDYLGESTSKVVDAILFRDAKPVTVPSTTLEETRVLLDTVRAAMPLSDVLDTLTDHVASEIRKAAASEKNSDIAKLLDVALVEEPANTDLEKLLQEFNKHQNASGFSEDVIRSSRAVFFPRILGPKADTMACTSLYIG